MTPGEILKTEFWIYDASKLHIQVAYTDGSWAIYLDGKIPLQASSVQNDFIFFKHESKYTCFSMGVIEGAIGCGALYPREAGPLQTAKKNDRYPHVCPACKSDAYFGGMNNIACSNPLCCYKE